MLFLNLNGELFPPLSVIHWIFDLWESNTSNSPPRRHRRLVKSGSIHLFAILVRFSGWRQHGIIQFAQTKGIYQLYF